VCVSVCCETEVERARAREREREKEREGGSERENARARESKSQIVCYTHSRLLLVETKCSCVDIMQDIYTHVCIT